MGFTGGSIEAIALRGRNYSVPADTDVTLKIGGFENEVEPNGDGTARLIKTRVSPAAAGAIVSVDDDNDDFETLQDVADGADFEPMTISLANGKVWQGDMQITGELARSTNGATASFDLKGTGKLTKQ